MGYSQTSGYLFLAATSTSVSLLNGAAPLPSAADDVRRTLVDPVGARRGSPAWPRSASRPVITRPGLLDDVVEGDARAPVECVFEPLAVQLGSDSSAVPTTAHRSGRSSLCGQPRRSPRPDRPRSAKCVSLREGASSTRSWRGTGAIEVSAGAPLRAFLRLTLFSRNGPTRVWIDGRAVRSSPGGTTVCVPVELDGGTTAVPVRTDAAPSSDEGDIAVTAPVVGGACGSEP